MSATAAPASTALADPNVAPRARWSFGWGGVLLAAVVLAHLPYVVVQAYQVWPKQHYQFIPMVPIAACVLASRRLAGYRGDDASVGVGYWLLQLIGVALFALAVATFSPWLGVLALVFNLGAAARLAGGADFARALRPAFLFLLLMLSIPGDGDVDLLTFLQRVTVRGSTDLYEWAGGLCLVSGATVQLPHAEKPLFVADACSGIQSLFAVLACTLFYLAWYGRGWIHGTLVVLSSFVWVMAANIGRVLAVIHFSKPGLFDLTQGTPHEILGVCTFLAAFLLTLSTDRLFLVVNPPRTNRFADDDAAPTSWSLQPPKAVAFASAVVLLALGGLSVRTVMRAAPEGKVSIGYKFDVPPLPPDFFPATVGDWRLVKFDGVTVRSDDDNMAARSQTWRYTNGSLTAIVAIDYPYPQFHDLKGCYQNIGWTVASEVADVPPANLPPAGNYVRLKMQKGADEHGYVAFSAFTIDGQPELAGEGVNLWGMLMTRGDQLLGKLLGKSHTKLRRPVYQIQAVTASPIQMTYGQTTQVDQLFLKLRQRATADRLGIAGK